MAGPSASWKISISAALNLAILAILVLASTTQAQHLSKTGDKNHHNALRRSSGYEDHLERYGNSGTYGGDGGRRHRALRRCTPGNGGSGGVATNGSIGGTGGAGGSCNSDDGSGSSGSSGSSGPASPGGTGSSTDAAFPGFNYSMNTAQIYVGFSWGNQSAFIDLGYVSFDVPQRELINVVTILLLV